MIKNQSKEIPWKECRIRIYTADSHHYEVQCWLPESEEVICAMASQGNISSLWDAIKSVQKEAYKILKINAVDFIMRD